MRCVPRPSSPRTRTPTSTRFASMLAVRRLYPGSVVCVSGSLNRNVRELCRLYAEELELVEASRLELDAVRRLIVVEAVNASRLGELEPVALDPAVEKVVFDHHAGDSPDWAQARQRRPVRGRRSDDDARRHPRRAGDRRIAARGDGLRARHPRGHGIADVSVGDAAGRRRALVVPAARRTAGPARTLPPHAALRGGASIARCAHRRARDARAAGDRRARGGDLVAELRRGRLEPRAQDRRPHGCPRARAARGDGPPRLLRRAQPHAVVRRGRGCWRTRRRRARAGSVGDLPGAARGCPAGDPRCAAGGGLRAASRPRRDVEAGSHRRADRHRRRGDGALPALQPERRARCGRRQARRLGGA